MFDTNIVVIGNVLTAPEWRRTASSNTLVANFRVASTARRVDKETGRWVDGNHLRVRVNCWRRLAEGVASSVTVGDPVVVAGRLYTRDWTDSEGNLRTTYEMEAVSVGHDLSRGRAKFFRTRSAATAAVENPETAGNVRGEAAAPIPDDDAPTLYGDGLPDTDEPTFDDVPARTPDGFEPSAALRGGGFAPFDTGILSPSPAPDAPYMPLATLPHEETQMLVESNASAAKSTGTAARPDVRQAAAETAGSRVSTEPGGAGVLARPDAGRVDAESGGAQIATAPGGSPATEAGGSPATEAGGSPATEAGGSPATERGGNSATEPNPRRMRGRVARRQPVAV